MRARTNGFLMKFALSKPAAESRFELIVRSTKAINAVERLKTRSGNPQYAAISLSGGLFYLVDRALAASKNSPHPCRSMISSPS